MIGLTTQQAKLLAFIKRYQAESGHVSPSYSDMMAELGIRSRGRIHVLVTALVERGHIRRPLYGHRAIEIVDHSPLHAVPTSDLIAELTRRGEWRGAA